MLEKSKFLMDDHLGLIVLLLMIDDSTFLEQCETHKQLNERENFWQHRLKVFYPVGLNEKEEYLY